MLVRLLFSNEKTLLNRAIEFGWYSALLCVVLLKGSKHQTVSKDSFEQEQEREFKEGLGGQLGTYTAPPYQNCN